MLAKRGGTRLPKGIPKKKSFVPNKQEHKRMKYCLFGENHHIEDYPKKKGINDMVKGKGCSSRETGPTTEKKIGAIQFPSVMES